MPVLVGHSTVSTDVHTNLSQGYKTMCALHIHGSLPALQGTSTPSALTLYPPVRAFPVQALKDTSVSFDKAVVGYPLEIAFSFTPEYNVTEGYVTFTGHSHNVAAILKPPASVIPGLCGLQNKD